MTHSKLPRCPKCDTEMVLKTIRGAHYENKFWGCSQYPKCLGNRPFVEEGAEGKKSAQKVAPSTHRKTEAGRESNRVEKVVALDKDQPVPMAARPMERKNNNSNQSDDERADEQKGRWSTDTREKPTMGDFFNWYVERFKKSILKLVAPESALIVKADPSQEHLASALTWSKNFEVGLIGQSQIGKSTLINAILSDPDHPHILPAGGIGPLTAQIIEVEHSDTRRASVTYHTADKINNLAFSLEKMSEEPTEDELANQKRRKLLAEAIHLIAGRQNTPRAKDYVIGVLKALVKKEPLENATLSLQFQEYDGLCYGKVLRSLLAGKEEVICTEEEPQFKEFVRDHASGCLAPLVKSMKLAWPSDLLRDGISLVDLPGIGVFNDTLPDVTQEWIRRKGRSVILVMRNNGLDNEAARTLKESGFLRRLLFSWEDRTDDPVQLILAVTQMDILAEGRAMGQDDLFPDEFKKCCTQIREMVRSQFSQLLEAEINSQDSGDVKEAKRKVAERLIAEVQIMPLSAQQYIYTLTKHQRAQFASPDETNVPALIQAIKAAAKARRDSINDEIERRKKNFCNQLSLVIDQISVENSLSVESRESLKTVKSEFAGFSKDLDRTLLARQGAFKNEITQQIPDKIESLMLKISIGAKESYSQYCRTMKDINWNTLKAAIRRGGTYHGSRRVDIQGTILGFVEEPIAAKFSSEVIRPTRKAAITLTEAYSEAIERIVVWISNRPEVKELAEQVRLIQRKLKADKEEIESIGEDRLKQLRVEVRAQIDTPLKKRIGARCDRFLETEESRGTGVKGRMLELVEDMGKDAIDSACQSAEKYLRDLYKTIYAGMMQKDLSALKRDLVKEIEEILFGMSQEIKRSSDVLRRQKLIDTLKTEYSFLTPAS